MASVDLSATEKDRAVRPIGLMLALLLAISSFQVAAAMILPALPAIVTSLGASNGDLSLSQSLFFAVGGLAAAGLPLSDRFGRQRMLVVILTLGLLGSVIVATAPGLVLFDLGRWLQATGVVALPLSFLILRDNVSADKFPFYIGWLSALNIGITGLDGVIAGWMTDTVGYRGIFWIAAAVGALAIVAAARVVPRTAPFRTGSTGNATHSGRRAGASGAICCDRKGFGPSTDSD
jgi:MFS family permease